MTLDQWFDKYFAPEYTNVQSLADWKAQARADLQQFLSNTKAAQPAAAQAASQLSP